MLDWWVMPVMVLSQICGDSGGRVSCELPKFQNVTLHWCEQARAVSMLQNGRKSLPGKVVMRGTFDVV
jgi:hypothetical protein